MGRTKEITFEEALEVVKNEIVDAATVADVLGVSQATINLWAQKKRIPAEYENGHYRRFRMGAVLKKLKSNATNRRPR